MASASRPVIPARTPRAARSFARAHDLVDLALLRRWRVPTTTVRVTSEQYPSTSAPKSISRKSPVLERRALDRGHAAAPSAGRDATIDGNGKPSLPSSRSAFSSTPATASSRHPGVNLRQRALERARRPPRRRLDQRHLARVLPLAQRLDEVHRRAPLPARARLEQPLEIAMQQMRRLEAERPSSVGSAAQLLPEPRPQALRLDRDARAGRPLRPTTCVW